MKDRIDLKLTHGEFDALKKLLALIYDKGVAKKLSDEEFSAAQDIDCRVVDRIIENDETLQTEAFKEGLKSYSKGQDLKNHLKFTFIENAEEASEIIDFNRGWLSGFHKRNS